MLWFVVSALTPKPSRRPSAPTPEKNMWVFDFFFWERYETCESKVRAADLGGQFSVISKSFTLHIDLIQRLM